MLRVGLNPYGINYCVGIFVPAQNTPRANPRPLGLDGYVKLCEELGVTGIELPDMLVAPLDESACAVLRERLKKNFAWTVLSSGPPIYPIDQLLGICKRLGIGTLRMGLTAVLCGGRGELGAQWLEIVRGAREYLKNAAARAADQDVSLAIENHQDFTSAELMEMCDMAGANVGVCMDTGNAFAVGEDPVAFARTVAPRIRHVHLKDYRAQWTTEGYRLIRCAIGDGAVPLLEVAKTLTTGGKTLTASIEPGALLARHIKILTPQWWQHYAPREARELAAGFAATGFSLQDHEDYRTPWEKGGGANEIIEYEMAQLHKSVANLKALKLM